MKNLAQLITIFVALPALMFLGSCDKTTEEIIEDITPNVTANIGGNQWTTDIAGGINTTVLLITAVKNKESVVLSLPGKDKGVYPIDLISTNASYLPVLDSLASAYVAYDGVVEITSINTLRTQIQGTFSFKAANAGTLDTITVSGGILKNIPIK